MAIVLHLGASGVAIGDIGAELYLEGVRSTAYTLGLSELSGGAYLVTGAPTAPASGRWYLTYQYPAGVAGSVSWPQDAATGAVVVPLRLTGQAGAISGARILDGAVQSPPAVAEIAATADYVLSGWERDEAGQHLISWTFGGATFAGPGWTTVAPRVSSSLDGSDSRFSASADRLGAEYGEDVYFERPNQLQAVDGSAVGSLLVKGAHAAGATSITLERVSSSVFTGSLPAGLGVTIEGAEYALASDAEADGLEITVSLTTGLVPSLSGGESVSIGDRYDRQSSNCIVAYEGFGRLPASLRDRVEMRIMVPLSEIDTEPQASWYARVGSQRGSVLRAVRAAGAYDVLVGAP